MSRLLDRVVLITGASRGVGAACALACAREGADVVLAAKSLDSHPSLPGTLKEVAEQVQALGRRAHVVQVDVREQAQVERMIEEAVDRFGRLDALVNNAGAIYWSPVVDHNPRRYDLVMQVNVRASFLAAHYALPHLRKNGGHIIMMSPPVCTRAIPGKAPYLISKLGMTLLAQAIDDEEANVHACALWPVTAIQTAATEVFGLGSPEQWRSVDILADATVALLARDPSHCRFHAWLDEEVLRAEGVTDFRKYRCQPDSEPSPMSIQLIDPDWTAPWEQQG
jgi:citronellol/citronellal dehydrogenase